MTTTQQLQELLSAGMTARDTVDEAMSTIRDALRNLNTTTRDLLNTHQREMQQEEAQQTAPPAEAAKYHLVPEGDLFRVVAARTFETLGGRQVCKGDEGGLVASDAVLSQEGTCWIGKGCVIRSATVRVYDNALLRDVEWAAGAGGVLFGDTRIRFAKINNGAYVHTDTKARIFGRHNRWAEINDSVHLGDRACIMGNVVINQSVTLTGAALLGCDDCRKCRGESPLPTVINCSLNLSMGHVGCDALIERGSHVFVASTPHLDRYVLTMHRGHDGGMRLRVGCQTPADFNHLRDVLLSEYPVVGRPGGFAHGTVGLLELIAADMMQEWARPLGCDDDDF